MSDIAALLMAHLVMAISTAVTIFLIVFVFWSRHTKSLFFKDFWAIIPLIGRMAEWKRSPEATGLHMVNASQPQYSYSHSSQLVPAEKGLYGYYSDAAPDYLTSRAAFERRYKWLSLAHQNGRRPMSGWFKILLVALTVAEALGTGMLVAPILSNTITPEVATVAGTVIAFAVAAVALFITHGAGVDLFRNELIRALAKSYRVHGGFATMTGDHVNSIAHISPGEEDQDKDAQYDSVARLAARLNMTSLPFMQQRWWKIVLAVAFIILFCSATGVYRHLILTKDADEAAIGMQTDAQPSTNFQSMFSNPSGNDVLMPADVAQASQDSAKQKQTAIQRDNDWANGAGVFLLGFIYVFTQALGILAGYKYSFFNEEGREAWRTTKGEIDYEAFLSHHVEPYAHRAQMRLGQLRTSLCRQHPDYSTRMKDFSVLEAWTYEAEFGTSRRQIAKLSAADSTRKDQERRAEKIAPQPVQSASVAAPVATSAPVAAQPAAPALAVVDGPEGYQTAAKILVDGERGVPTKELVATIMIENHLTNDQLLKAAIREYKLKKAEEAARAAQPTVGDDVLGELGPSIGDDLLEELA